ncbi:uncharacterized protein [Montipora capricornis]|uniref:uncharacterized protein n=1 Tax=Montipora foliosa TaxID=591990 RepID=UPI0035F1FA5B
MRPVIDLSSLNKFIVNEHFQMENLSCLKTLLLPGDFMTNIDLKDAYLSVPVHETSRKFLRFIWKGTCYQFKALPFGLCSAPRIFTKALKPVAAFLRRKAIRVLIYLDDFLLLAATVEEAVKNTQLVVSLLQSLGFTINLKKSLLTPTQAITFLGFQIDSTCMMLSLPAEKTDKILDCCHRLLVSQSITLRNLASLIGLLESSRPAIWRAPLHFRHLQSDLIRGLQMNQESYDALIALSPSARVELAWWLRHTLNANGSPVHLPPPDMIITTDASKKGWGAVHQSFQTNGRWSQKESLQHINYLELKASFLALKTFLKDKSHVSVSLQLDNTTAIAYINNKGGTRSPQLMTLALEMWDWCQERDILLIASHIPGRDNVSADKESREFTDMSEWKLDPIIIQPFLLNCQTDLFASRLTSQLAAYISWRPDPGAIHTDAFTINWATLRGYAFPPFNLISKTLTKVTIDQTELILVAPVWQAQPWWPVLLRLLISQPVLLPNSPTLLTDPTDLNRIHPMYPRLHLAVFHISTNVSKLRAFQQTLPTYSSQQLVPPHTKPTSLVGTVGAAGVLDGKLILFRHL